MKSRNETTVAPQASARTGVPVTSQESKRPSKSEQRVYLDDHLVDFLDELRRARGFRFGSQALRYCILQEYLRTGSSPHPAAKAASEGSLGSAPGDRQ